LHLEHLAGYFRRGFGFCDNRGVALPHEADYVVLCSPVRTRTGWREEKDSNSRSLLRPDRSSCDKGMPLEAKRTVNWPPSF
jgi:hypothetical protein